MPAGAGMRWVVGCESSGRVRGALRALGHDAYSCDLLPCEDDSPFHIQDDILRVVRSRFFDGGIFHPPCTYLAVSGNPWLNHPAHPNRRALQAEALEFVRELLAAPIERIALENPISVISSRIRKPDQIIQPWMFGHPETKATCLWLKNLPKLEPTNNVYAEMLALPKSVRSRVHYASPGPDRWKNRSRTLPGIAAAMAAQWGGGALNEEAA